MLELSRLLLRQDQLDVVEPEPPGEALQLRPGDAIPVVQVQTGSQLGALVQQ